MSVCRHNWILYFNINFCGLNVKRNQTMFTSDTRTYFCTGACGAPLGPEHACRQDPLSRRHPGLVSPWAMGGTAAHLRPGRSGPRTRSHRCRTGSSLPPPNHRAHFLPQLQSPRCVCLAADNLRLSRGHGIHRPLVHGAFSLGAWPPHAPMRGMHSRPTLLPFLH